MELLGREREKVYIIRRCVCVCAKLHELYTLGIVRRATDSDKSLGRLLCLYRERSRKTERLCVSADHVERSIWSFSREYIYTYYKYNNITIILYILSIYISERNKTLMFIRSLDRLACALYIHANIT